MASCNTARYLEEAIESVLSQKDASYELLIGDDCSQDSSRQKLKRYRQHPAVRLFLGNRRKGPAKLRNDLIRQSKSTFICPVDSDDILLPGALQRMSEIFKSNPSLGLVYGDCLMFYEDKTGRPTELPRLCQIDSNSIWNLVGSRINHGGCLMKRECFWAAGGYDERTWFIEDFSLLLRFEEMFPIKYLKGETYYLWRRHPKSGSQRIETGPAVLRILKEVYERRERAEI